MGPVVAKYINLVTYPKGNIAKSHMAPLAVGHITLENVSKRIS